MVKLPPSQLVHAGDFTITATKEHRARLPTSDSKQLCFEQRQESLDYQGVRTENQRKEIKPPSNFCVFLARSQSMAVNVYYARPVLPDVYRVLACLYEKEIEFELVDMHAGQQMPLDFLKLQSNGRAPVPAFEDGSTFLLESRAICRYASEKYQDHGNRYLLGRDLLERGSIEQWLKTEEHSFNPPSLELVFHLAFDPSDQPLLAQSEQALARVLDVYEHRLRESKYLAGDEFTLADLSHLPNSHYIANSEQWGCLFESRKNVLRWWEMASRRPSWEKVVQMLGEFEASNGSTAEEIVSATAKVNHSSRSSTRALLVPQSSTIWLKNGPEKTPTTSPAVQAPSMASTVKNGSKAPNSSKSETENVVV
ncbi:glutathione S-transferase F11-like [Curcuma longa]|uniref:glutathione S-transferase F11-like n=1 Tax=Curcuma longa TaxID=136217 RepID=UPI003D9EEB5F